MYLIDHTEKDWYKRHKTYGYGGALTYSQDIVKYQIPHWEKIVPEKTLISTCPLLQNVTVEGQYDLVIQYLHKYPYKFPANYVKGRKTYSTKRTIYITAYKEYQAILRRAGYEVAYVPMGIDVKDVQRHRKDPEGHNKFIYYGNLTKPKRGVFRSLRSSMRKFNREMDYISFGKLNGQGSAMTQQESWELISTYKYGVGVGRSALEMYALGLKVLIAGPRFGGLVCTEGDFQKQLMTNTNGRYATHSGKFPVCLRDINKSLNLTSDIVSMNHAEMVDKQLCINVK